MSAFNQIDQKEHHSHYKELSCCSKEPVMPPNTNGLWNCPLACVYWNERHLTKVLQGLLKKKNYLKKPIISIHSNQHFKSQIHHLHLFPKPVPLFLSINNYPCHPSSEAHLSIHSTNIYWVSPPICKANANSMSDTKKYRIWSQKVQNHSGKIHQSSNIQHTSYVC